MRNLLFYLFIPFCLSLFSLQGAFAEDFSSGLSLNEVTVSALPRPTDKKEGSFRGVDPIVGTKKIMWTQVNPGLEFFEERLDDSSENMISMVRIDPKQYAFSLHMASEEGSSQSLRSWADRHGLDAAINASMFLPDKLTSIGHMQSSTHVNNQHIGNKLGAFFLAEPVDTSLPLAAIVEREGNMWERLLPMYTIKVQNFRIISKGKKILWNSDNREYSIAAIANDNFGNILFILCQKALTGAAFARQLLDYDLALTSVVYVEGGEKAALFLRDSAGVKQWTGRKNLLNIKGDPTTMVPNVIGIKKRQTVGEYNE